MNFPVPTFNEIKKVWTTPKTPMIYNSECALGRIIFQQLQTHPDIVLQIDHSANVTLKNRDVLTMAIRIAQHFHRMQLRQDDVIGFAVKNTTYVLPALLGCFFNCTPFHPINPISDESTMTHCFGSTKPQVIFCDSEVYEKVYLATKAFKPKIYTISGAVEGVEKVTDLLEPTKTELFYNPKHYSMGDHQTVAIIGSSGTTGKPKAVCLSAHNLLYETSFLNSKTIMYVPSAISWATGLKNLVLSCLAGATRVIVDQSFNCDIFFELVKKYKITTVFLDPRSIAALVKHPQATKENFSSIMIVQTGGSAITESIYNSLRHLLNDYAVVLFGYGLTEFGVLACNFLTPFAPSPVTAVGRLFSNISLRIIDDDGNNVGYNQVGEICLNHGKYWGGYYGNPIETQKMRDAQGWFHTGDLGYMDENHYMHLVDRKREIRKHLGFHFSPKEIEEAIVEMPGVKDVCIITVSEDTRGDCSGALVVKTANSSITERDVINYVKSRFADVHKQIHVGVFFVDEIPQNANGKVMRTEAKKIFESKLARNLIC